MKKHEKIALQMFKDQDFDEYEVPLLVEILQECDDLYTNDDNGSYLTDPEYDFLRQFTYAQAPTNVYFTGIGSAVRGEKVKLPHTMGSLDQVYVGEFDDWKRKWNLSDENIVVSDKLDGTSAMVIYDDSGDFQIAYSRGDGIEGADISRHMRKVRSVPDSIPLSENITIRGENIFEFATFRYLRSNFFRQDGKPYKNPRNMMAGVMNAEEKDEGIYDFVKFVAYEIVGSKMSKSQQLEVLHGLGFETVESIIYKAKDLSDESLTNFLALRKQNSIYELDGIVLDVDDHTKRSEMNPTRDTLNPAYTIKYKVTTEDSILEIPVINVEYNPSRYGYMKPRVNLKPTEMGGVTVSWATGFNAKFIESNHIGPGAVLRVTRSGDVIPFIMGVVTAVEEPQMPDEFEWEWSKNEVDAILVDPMSHPIVAVKRLTSFFDKIDAPLLKIGNVQKLFDKGYKTVESIIRASEEELIDVLGKNGSKIYEGLHEKLTNAPLYKLIGAHSTERGVGVRRMKKLQEAFGRDGLFECDNVPQIVAVEGFDQIMAEASMVAIEDFRLFYYENQAYISLAEEEQRGTALAGEKVCVTGFRDKELSAKIEAEGGTVQSSVSGKTTILVAKDPDSNSGKPKKARELGIPIMGVEEFKEKYSV